MKTVLSTASLAKSYKSAQGRINALLPVDISVKKGEFVCIIGPNGCGKSTLIKMAAGILEPSGGSVAKTDKSSYLPQQPSLLPWRTVKENLTLYDDLQKSPGKKPAIGAGRLLNEFGLGEFADFYPHSLSGGMQQKAALLRTVIAKPELMLLDEPFSALDAITRSELQSWLLGLWQRSRPGVMCVTHDMREAVFLADTIYVLSKRPGTIKKKITVDLPRPRRRGHLLLKEAKKLEKQLIDLLEVD